MRRNKFEGQRFGKWTVKEFARPDKTKHTLWLCVCDCGVERLVVGTSLTRGISLDCGCGRNVTTVARCTKHGHNVRGARSPEYISWAGMIQRCTNPNNPKFVDYGARGISVYEPWFEFENFLADMGRKPSSDLSIHRVDNDGNYCPSNCVWADAVTQANNKRNSRKRVA